jgi:hypothetical protein
MRWGAGGAGGTVSEANHAREPLDFGFARALFCDVRARVCADAEVMAR